MLFMRIQITVIFTYLTILNGRCFLLIKTDEPETENLSLKFLIQNGSEDLTKVFLPNEFQKQEENGIRFPNLTDLSKIETLLYVQDGHNSNQTLKTNTKDFYLLKELLKYINNNSSKSTTDIELLKRIGEDYSYLNELNDENATISFPGLNISNNKNKSKDSSLHSLVTEGFKISIPSKSYAISYHNRKTSSNDIKPKLENIFSNFTQSTLQRSTEMKIHYPSTENQAHNYKTNNKRKILKYGNQHYLLTPVSLNSAYYNETTNKINSNPSADIVKLFQSENSQDFQNQDSIRTKYNRSTAALLNKLLKILNIIPNETLTPITTFQEPPSNERNITLKPEFERLVGKTNIFTLNQTMVPPNIIFKNNSTKSFHPVIKNENNIKNQESHFRSKEYGRQLGDIFVQVLPNTISSTKSLSDSNLGNVPEMSSTAVQLNNEHQINDGSSLTIDSVFHDQNQKLESEPVINNFSGLIHGREISTDSYTGNILSNSELEQRTVENTEISPKILKGVLVGSSSNFQNSKNVDESLVSFPNFDDQNFESEKDYSKILISPLPDPSMTERDTVINQGKDEVMLLGNSPNDFILNKESSSLSNFQTEPNPEAAKENPPTIVKGILVKTLSDIFSSGNRNEDKSILLSQDVIPGVTNPKINIIQSDNDNANSIPKETGQSDDSNLQTDNVAEGVLSANHTLFEKDDTLDETQYTFVGGILSSNINNPKENFETLKIQNERGDINIDLITPRDGFTGQDELTKINNPEEPFSKSMLKTDSSEGIAKEIDSDRETEIINEYLRLGLPPGMNLVFNEEQEIPEIILSNNFLTSKDKILITTSKGHKVLIRSENEDELKEATETFGVIKKKSQIINKEINQETVNLETSITENPVQGYYDQAGHFVHDGSAHLQVHDDDTPQIHTRDSEIYRNKGPLWWISTKDGFAPTGGIEATKGFVFKLKEERSDTSSNQRAEAREASFI